MQEKLFEEARSLGRESDVERNPSRQKGLKGFSMRLLNESVIGAWEEVADGWNKNGTPRRTVQLEDGDMAMELGCAKTYRRVK